MPSGTAATSALTARLRLVRTEGVGPITYRKLMERFATPEQALAALPALARKGGRSATLRIPSVAEAARELEQLAAFGARLLWLHEPDYPTLLAQTDAAPPAIAVFGDVAALNARCVALVGARNASGNGKRIAEQLAHDLAASGLVVVSGMARGIDAAAHTGALAAGRTVAAIAGGVDVAYPEQNAALQRQVGQSGAVVAEAPFGTAPQARHFPRRNRIIAGLSLGTVVVEAAEQSGSLITARLAAEFGRDLFAVPGSPLDPRCRGSNGLLRDGARLVETARDVLSDLGPAVHAAAPARLSEARAPPPEPPHGDVDQARRLILENLGYDPITLDALTLACGVPVEVVAAALLELELAGRVEVAPGHRICLLAHAPLDRAG